MNEINKPLIEKKSFTKIDYSEKSLSGIEFYSCTFIGCNFTNSDISNSDFMDCKFVDCNFSIVKLNNTGLKNVSFKGCKLLGVDFRTCKDFLLSFYFEKCSLDYSGFQKKKIAKTIFNQCTIKEVDFSFADLTASSFLHCDLTRTLFQQTILEKVDFRTAYNYSIDLESNKIKKAKFSLQGIVGLLDKYDIEIE